MRYSQQRIFFIMNLIRKAKLPVIIPVRELVPMQFSHEERPPRASGYLASHRRTNAPRDGWVSSPPSETSIATNGTINSASDISSQSRYWLWGDFLWPRRHKVALWNVLTLNQPISKLLLAKQRNIKLQLLESLKHIYLVTARSALVSPICSGLVVTRNKEALD